MENKKCGPSLPERKAWLLRQRDGSPPETLPKRWRTNPTGLSDTKDYQDLSGFIMFLIHEGTETLSPTGIQAFRNSLQGFQNFFLDTVGGLNDYG